jgi:hypothetical protein
MSEPHPKRTLVERIERYTTRFLTLIAILLGLAFLGWGLAIGEESKEHWWPTILREVGLALLIAAVVGFIYETAARTHFIRSSISVILSKIFGTIVTEDVWREVSDRILKREMIREDMNIFLKLPADFNPEDSPTELWMKYDYKLKGLHARPEKKSITIMHYLDDHLEDKARQLPRFDAIVVGGKSYETKELKYVFTANEEVSNLPHEYLQVEVERTELTYVPGIYNVTMTEMTKGISLYLQHLPESLEAVVDIRPYRVKIPLKINEHKRYEDILLLPGQNIEIRFKYKEGFGPQLSSPPPGSP